MDKLKSGKPIDKKKKVMAAVLIAVLLYGIWYVAGHYLFKSDEITATGTIEATTVKVAASVPGLVGKIYYKEGDKVAKGDVVAEITRNDLVSLLAQNEATLAKSKLGLAQVTSSALVQQLDSARAQASAAYETMKKAETDYNRFKALYEQGATSLAELERFQTAYNISRDYYTSAQAQVNSLQGSGGTSAQIGSARTDVDKAQAGVDSVASQISDLTLKAPLDGVVTSKNFEEGEYVTAGVAVATIADLENLWIKVYVTTEELPAISLGQTVRFTVSGIDEEFEGKIINIADKGEYTPKTVLTVNERANVVFAVKIEANGSNGVLKPGMPADVIF